MTPTPPMDDIRAVFFHSDTIWLTPNELTRRQLTRELLAQAESGGALAPRLETFASLESRLSAELAPPEADDLTRRFILNRLAGPLAEHLGLAGDDDFSPADRQALAENLGDGLDRLKLAGLSWAEVALLPPKGLGRTLAGLGRAHDQKMAELGRLDRFGRRRLMLDELAAGRPFAALKGVEKILCRWSRRLSPFETDFILALARNLRVEVRLTVPQWVLAENIDHGAGFDLLRAIRRLEKSDSPGLWLEFGDYSASPPALAHAAEALLAPPEMRPENPPEPDGRLTIVQTPTAYQEAEEAGRLLKARLAAGIQPENLALVVPDLEVYGPFLDDVARRFGLAFHLRRGAVLAEAGPVKAILDLLALWRSNWERSRLTEILTNPYFIFQGPEGEENLDAAALNRLTLTAGITDRRAGGGFENLGRGQGGPLGARVLIVYKKLQAAGRALADAPDWAAFFRLFKTLLNQLRWPGRLDLAPAEPVNLKGADLAAAQAFKEELEKLETALKGPEAPPVGPAAFGLWLETVCRERRLIWDADPEGRVRVLNYHDLHGGKFDEIIFLGLNEQVFPKTSSGLNWWPDDFTRAAAGLLGRPLWNEAADSYRQDELLLADGLSQARERVWLFYHAGGETGRAALPSPLLTALRELWPDGEDGSLIKEIRAGWSLPPAWFEAAGPDELRVALMALDQRNWPEPFKSSAAWLGLAAELKERSEKWRLMKKGVKLPPETVARWLSLRPTHQGAPLAAPSFAASFAACPLAFWAGEMLGLGEDGQALEEWPKTSEGELAHQVLEKFFHPRLGRAWPGAAEFEPTLMELNEILESELAFHDERRPLGRRPLWDLRRQKLKELFKRWLTRELGTESVRPLALEWAFGPEESAQAPPYEFNLNDGRSIYFKGRVDRIDESGPGLAVRDYKLSAGGPRYQVKAGDQEFSAAPAAWPILIYTLAVRAAFDRPVESSFEILNAGEKGGRLPALGTEDPGLADSSPSPNFQDLLTETWLELEKGDFKPQSDETGCAWCALSLICPRSDSEDEEETA